MPTNDCGCTGSTNQPQNSPRCPRCGTMMNNSVTKDMRNPGSFVVTFTCGNANCGYKTSP